MVIRVQAGYERGYGGHGMFTPSAEKINNKIKEDVKIIKMISPKDILKSGGMTSKNVSIKSFRHISTSIPAIKDINENLKKYDDYLNQMSEETNKWLNYAEAANNIMNEVYISGLLNNGASVISNVICSAINSRISNGTVTYTRDTDVGANPTTNPLKTYRIDSSGTIPQGTINTPGRMNGPEGWSVDKDMIAGVLASYAHNYVAMLLAFFKRPKLPLNNPVTLPNMVLADTTVPTQFVPPLSTSFSILPSPIMQNTIRIAAPVDSSFHAIYWDSGKNEIARTESIQVKAGTTDIVVQAILAPWNNMGFLNIEPDTAPKGLVIESISAFPPSL